MEHLPGLMLVLLAAAAGGGLVAYYAGLFTRTRFIVYDYQCVLLYKKGQFEKILPTGVHKLRQRVYSWVVFDKRVSQLLLVGQEVLTKDGMGIKLSTYAEYAVEDALKLCQTADVTAYSLPNYLHAIAQLPVRAAVAQQTLEELMADRATLAGQISAALVPKLQALGIGLRACGIRDIMLSKEVREAFAGELLAKKQAAMLLEATRAETAALRSLANAARVTRENPDIMKLRVLQALQSNPGKNTIVVDFAGDKGVPAVASGEDLA